MPASSPRAKSAVLHRNLCYKPPSAVRGRGCYLFDQSGAAYLDASGGAAVSCLGHGHPRVIAAIERQLAALEYAHTSFFTNEACESLAVRLVARAPAGFGAGRVAFVGSGSEAIEAALKLARQYFVEVGEPARSRFISRSMSYHGNTLGALAVGGHVQRRALYQPMLVPTSQIAPCHAYRFQRVDEPLTEYATRVADELEAEILRLGPETVAAFVAEPVVGATLGSVPAALGYFRRIRDICDRYGVLLIADEVMCGMGRTGTLFAIEEECVRPDLITIAKGLGAGYQPIGAVLASERVIDAIVGGSGILAHGHTYMSHAVACAAALAVLDALDDEGLLDHVVRRGRNLEDQLREAFGTNPHVGDIRGRGLFWSIEIVRDRETKAPFERSGQVAETIKAIAYERGLICYPSSGTADGVRGDHVLLAPPYIVTADQIGEIVDKLAFALNHTLAAQRLAA